MRLGWPWSSPDSVTSDIREAVLDKPSILRLDRLVEALPPLERQLFHRLFFVDVSLGETRPPEEMRPYIEENFGSVEAVQRQQIVKVANLVTLEGALFNGLRARRPLEARDVLALEAQIINGHLFDPFRAPLEATPEDAFGRIRGRYCVTASNVAKFDGQHGVIIFDEPHPLRFAEEQVTDYLDTAMAWFGRAHRHDPEARYPLLIWNCLWRAGASINHGHAQVVLGRGMHYVQVEAWRRAAQGYRESWGSGYFEDLCRVHRPLGLMLEKEGVSILTSLTPKKEKEVLLLAPELNPSFKERLYEVLACFRDRLGVSSFNLAIYLPPLGPTPETWEGFPIVARMVDRGEPGAKASDMGAMELYAQSVVSADPFEVARMVRETIGE